MPDLTRYLARIGFESKPKADLATLKALVRAHVTSIPFENIDVQLGQPLTTGPLAAVEKIVERGRGGWCFEMNGAFGWALDQIGFDVTRVAGGVNRKEAGDSVIGNHLCLLVKLDRLYLTDVGFGGSLLAPLALETGAHNHSPFQVSLQQVDCGFWRFSEDFGDGAFTFDFQAEAADESLLKEKCGLLQSRPDSPFVQNLVAQRRGDEYHVSLRGRVLKRITPHGVSKEILPSSEALVETLKSVFGIDLPAAGSLWPAICARHDAVFRKQPEDAN